MRDATTDPLKGKCPLSGCRLLHLGWARQAPETSVSYHYCPPCDQAFLGVDERTLGGRLLVLKSHVEDNRLTSWPPDVSHGTRLTQREILIHRDELQEAVRRFKEGRMITKQWRCAGNHGPGDRLSQWGVMMERSLYISGCDACLIAFAQAREEDYGWELAITFGFDIAHSTWNIRQVHRPTMDPSVQATCLALLERLRSGYDPMEKTFANRPWGLV
jgi:hypothetical protein